MINGVVNLRREAVVPLRLREPGGATTMIDGVIDTGFTGLLALPQATVNALALPHLGGGSIFLANGVRHRLEIYSVEVFRDGIWRPANAPAIRNDCLIGVGLLDGYEFRAQFQSNSIVEISKLP